MRLGDLLIVFGIVLVVIGIVFKVFPMLGRLPGDIIIKGDGYSIYIPIATSILLSIVLTIVLNIIGRFLGGAR